MTIKIIKIELNFFWKLSQIFDRSNYLFTTGKFNLRKVWSSLLDRIHVGRQIISQISRILRKNVLSEFIRVVENQSLIRSNHSKFYDFRLFNLIFVLWYSNWYWSNRVNSFSRYLLLLVGPEQLLTEKFRNFLSHLHGNLLLNVGFGSEFLFIITIFLLCWFWLIPKNEFGRKIFFQH